MWGFGHEIRKNGFLRRVFLLLLLWLRFGLLFLGLGLGLLFLMIVFMVLLDILSTHLLVTNFHFIILLLVLLLLLLFLLFLCLLFLTAFIVFFNTLWLWRLSFTLLLSLTLWLLFRKTFLLISYRFLNKRKLFIKTANNILLPLLIDLHLFLKRRLKPRLFFLFNKGNFLLLRWYAWNILIDILLSDDRKSMLILKLLKIDRSIHRLLGESIS